MSHLFEKYFKAKLVDRQPGVNNEDWLALQQRLYNIQRKPRGIAWWTLPTIILLAGAIGWGLSNNAVEDNNIIKSPISQMEQGKNATAPKELQNLQPIPDKRLEHDKVYNHKDWSLQHAPSNIRKNKRTILPTNMISTPMIKTETNPASNTISDMKMQELNTTTNKEPQLIPSSIVQVDSAKKAVIRKQPSQIKHQWLLGVSISPALAQTRNLSADSSFERLNGSQNKLGFSTMLLASYLIKNIEINSGFGYSQINTEARYRITYPTYDSFPVLDTAGHVIGYLYQNYRDSIYNKNIMQHINRLSIPISIAYIFYNRNKWSFPVRVGVQMDISRTNYNINSSSEPSLSINPFLLSGTVQTGVRYKANKNLYIYLEPKYAFGLNNIYKNHLNERLNNISLAMSALYKF